MRFSYDVNLNIALFAMGDWKGRRRPKIWKEKRGNFLAHDIFDV